jgi:ABC-type polysaccharide/polyol phosphate transport system ATPase subunit
MGDRHPAVIVENVTKRFVLSSSRPQDLRERFGARGATRSAPHSFLALDNIGFTIAPGESVGIVGHNGSGKSTLLKLLTGIMKPTTGRVTVHGRLGALIEVGAGFHPDLTGRENIFLNGAILGVSRRELTERFDDIVAFAGLERFIDTPVKRYSSGMYMRLGFAIVAHMDPEVLLIDEVLAVGDQQFQNRCLSFLRDFVRRGGTAIFVSHSMPQVERLCERCIWLDHGVARYDGETVGAIQQYLAMVTEREAEEHRRRYPDEVEPIVSEPVAPVSSASGPLASRQLLSVTLRDPDGLPTCEPMAGQPLSIEIAYSLSHPLREPIFDVEIFRLDGARVIATSSADHARTLAGLPSEGALTIAVPFFNLDEGVYRLALRLRSTDESEAGETLDDALQFTVARGRFVPGCAFLPVVWPSPEASHE